MLSVNNDATWVATGNNVEVSDEMARRIMPIRLDAGLERPEVGRTFQHPDLLTFVRQNRTRLVSACLSLVRSWVEAGMSESTARVGSFESWAGVLGGILRHAGIPGLLEGRERFAAQADSETTEWTTLLSAWWATFGTRAVNASEVLNDVIRKQNLLMDVWAGRSSLAASQRIGRAISTRRDRVYGGYAIRGAGQDAATRNAAYRLERTTGYKTPETPGTAEKARQEQRNTTGCLLERNTQKHPETPGNTPQNTQGNNPVPDDETNDGRVFRVFDDPPAEKDDEALEPDSWEMEF
jgi:putative DNA primase/helicase